MLHFINLTNVSQKIIFPLLAKCLCGTGEMAHGPL